MFSSHELQKLRKDKRIPHGVLASLPAGPAIVISGGCCCCYPKVQFSAAVQLRVNSTGLVELRGASGEMLEPHPPGSKMVTDLLNLLIC